MPLRIAHFSDLHYADETLAEVDRCFSHAVDHAIACRVDVAVITGDTTDHALNAHSPALVALARQIQRLADHCPVLMLQGTFSHEPPGFLSLFPLIRGRHSIWIADRLQQVALTRSGNWIASDGWQFDTLPDTIQLICTCIPTLNRAALATAVGASGAACAMDGQLERVLAGYAKSHLAARQAGIPIALLSHGTVHGCVTEHGVPMAGPDHEFTTGALFEAQATAVLLGHIHKHQAWAKDGRRIAYAGSIGRLHYGEEGDKGFLLWEVDSDQATAALQPTPARCTIDIAFDGPPDLEKLAQFVGTHTIDDAWVRVRWQVLEEERDWVDRAGIESQLAGAAGVKLEGRIIPVVRARATGIARELSLSRQIERWATLVDVGAPVLLPCLEQLDASSPEKIATKILQQPSPRRTSDQSDGLALNCAGHQLHAAQ
jgi:DNA repair protein SbcD/Mre11